jgi:hypothetical protein
MALFHTRSAAIFGIDAHLIDVEVDMYPGQNRDFITVGMPDTAVRESRERIKSALMNSGFGYRVGRRQACSEHYDRGFPVGIRACSSELRARRAFVHLKMSTLQKTRARIPELLKTPVYQDGSCALAGC